MLFVAALLGFAIGYFIRRPKKEYIFDNNNGNYGSYGVSKSKSFSTPYIPSELIKLAEPSEKNVSELLPFKGSNLEGRWEQDGKGEWGYVVLSYGWYPIYIYKYKKWFETSGTYSSSTSKQMRNTRPTRWNDKLGKQMLICDRNEMGEIRKGSITPDQLVVNKNNKFIYWLSRHS
jgi:hypothetical protein